MSTLLEIINRVQTLMFLSVIVILIMIIGVIDYVTGPEFSFSIFYIILIAALSINRNTKTSAIYWSSIMASLVWFTAEYASRHYSNVFFPIWNAFVRFSTFASIGLLIYYLKERHTQLNRTNLKLEELNEEKNELIGIAAHDLRNPVSGINAFSGIVLDKYRETSNSEVKEAIEYINSLSEYSLSMLEELLDVAKIEAGRFNLKMGTYDYIGFLKRHIAINEILARNKNICIQLETDIHGWVLTFDKNYLGEVIDNLLSNAIKFSHRNSIILIRASLSDTSNVITEVIDYGTGIKEDEQSRLFNYFHTTSVQPTEGEKSTGLGLAIAKKIVTMHNGEIGVKSAYGTGSTFYYTLPHIRFA